MTDINKELKDELYELYQDTHSYSQLCAVIDKHLPKGCVVVKESEVCQGCFGIVTKEGLKQCKSLKEVNND